MRRTTMIVAGLLLAGAGCATSKYEKAAADSAAKLEATQKELDATKQQLAAATQERDQLQAQTASLHEQKTAAEAKSTQYEQLNASLQKQIASGQIEVSELRDRMIVKMSDKVLFPSGSARITKDGRGALDSVAEAFKALEHRNVVVAGFTDDVPVAKKSGYKDNWDLSTARALAVVRYLVEKGVPPSMLGAAGFGEHRPVAPNTTAENRSQNRRIEIALTPAAENEAEQQGMGQGGQEPQQAPQDQTQQQPQGQ